MEKGRKKLLKVKNNVAGDIAYNLTETVSHKAKQVIKGRLIRKTKVYVYYTLVTNQLRRT